MWIGKGVIGAILPNLCVKWLECFGAVFVKSVSTMWACIISTIYQQSFYYKPITDNIKFPIIKLIIYSVVMGNLLMGEQISL